jgi:hypothetical protein
MMCTGMVVEYDSELLAPLGVVCDKEQLADREVCYLIILDICSQLAALALHSLLVVTYYHLYHMPLLSVHVCACYLVYSMILLSC